MPSKTKLEHAVEEAASRLNAAQREIVMAQLRDYKANRDRIMLIGDALSARGHAAGDAAQLKATLASERAELMKANAEISDKLFRQLEG